MRDLINALLKPGEITFRQLLLLALPALLVGFVLRVALIVALPQGYFGSDSHSYYEFAHQLYDHGVIYLNEKRRWLYPLFLAFWDGFPMPGWSLVPLIQHATGLLTIVGIGWCSAQLVERPKVVVPLVTTLAALWPRMLWYEHEFIAESLFLAAFVAVIALLLTPDIVHSRYGLIVLMLAFVLLAGMKGAGRFLWMGSVLGLFVIHHDPRRWLWGKISLFLACLSVLLVSTIGKNSQGDWLALSSTLPLVRMKGEPYSRYRTALKEQILEARQYGDDYPWVMKIYKKRLSKKSPDDVHSDWGELNRNKPEFSKVARSFWSEAIINQPLQFAGLTLKTMAIAMSSTLLDHRLDPAHFWREQQTRIAERWLNNPRYFNRLFGVNQSGFELKRQQGRHRRFQLLPSMSWVDRNLRWLGRTPDDPSGGGYPGFTARPLGLMALLGAGAGVLLSGQRLQCLVLLLPLTLYLFGTYAVGDAVPRYLQPVEWIGFVFVGVLLDLMLQAGVSGCVVCRRWLVAR